MTAAATLLSKTSNRTIVFAIEALREMFTESAWDSRKFPALDTYHRIREGEVVLSDTKKYGRNAKILNPLIDEIAWSIKTNIAAKSFIEDSLPNISSFIDDFIKRNRSQSDIQSAETFIRFLKSRLDESYYYHLTDQMVSLLKTEKKEDLHDLLKSWSSFCVNIGHSPAFIKEQIDEVFLNDGRDRITVATVRSFFRIFNDKIRWFDVYFAINASSARAISSIEFGDIYIENIADVPAQAAPSVQDLCDSFTERSFANRRRRGSKARIIRIRVKAPDHHAAIKSATEIIDLLDSILQNIISKARLQYSSDSVVCEKQKICGVFPSPSRIFRRSTFVGTRKPGADLSTFFADLAKSKLQRNSVTRIVRAIQTSAMARRALNDDQALASLWSAFEVLLPEPDMGQVRILSYLDHILPCLMSNHTERTLRIIYDDIRKFDKKNLEMLVDDIGNFENGEQRLGAILLINNYQDRLSRLTNALSEQPLILFRMHQFQKSHKSVSSLLDYLQRHSSRIEWQIHRIYRCRNFMVHSGVRFPFIRTLVQNLDQYFSETFNIIMYESAERRYRNIDEVFLSIQMAHKARIHFLSINKKKPIDEDLLSKIVFYTK